MESRRNARADASAFVIETSLPKTMGQEEVRLFAGSGPTVVPARRKRFQIIQILYHLLDESLSWTSTETPAIHPISPVFL
jgi:hypothetical protein